MAQELILGIGIISFLLIYLALNIDEDHALIKNLMFLFSITIMLLIPTSLVDYTQGVVFHKMYLGFYWVFWIYIIIYVFYSVMKKFGLIVSKSNKGGRGK